jgi:ribosomal protein L25 (general stress protein Ctc)
MIDDDPTARELLRNLEGIRIRVYEVDGDPVEIAEDLNHMSAQLREQGWEAVILIRDEGETTHVLLKVEQQRVAGLTVLTSDSLEVVLVNVMGELRPDLLEEAMVAIDAPVPDIDV